MTVNVTNCSNYSNGICASCISPQILNDHNDLCFNPIANCLSYDNAGKCRSCNAPKTLSASNTS